MARDPHRQDHRHAGRGRSSIPTASSPVARASHAVAGILSHKGEYPRAGRGGGPRRGGFGSGPGADTSTESSLLAIATASARGHRRRGPGETRWPGWAKQKDFDRARREARATVGHRRNQLASERNEIEAVRLRTEGAHPRGGARGLWTPTAGRRWTPRRRGLELRTGDRGPDRAAGRHGGRTREV